MLLNLFWNLNFGVFFIKLGLCIFQVKLRQHWWLLLFLLFIFVFFFAILLSVLFLLLFLIFFVRFNVFSMFLLELFFLVSQGSCPVSGALLWCCNALLTLFSCFFCQSLSASDVLFTGGDGVVNPFQKLSESNVMGVNFLLVECGYKTLNIVQSLILFEFLCFLLTNFVFTHSCWQVFKEIWVASDFLPVKAIWMGLTDWFTLCFCQKVNGLKDVRVLDNAEFWDLFKLSCIIFISDESVSNFIESVLLALKVFQFVGFII